CQAQATSPQAQAAQNNAAIRARVAASVKGSGMSADQIRLQLKSMGYSDNVINQVIGAPGADTTGAVSEDVFLALRSLGIADSARVDSMRTPLFARSRAKTAADSLLLDDIEQALQSDSMRTAIIRVLNSPAARRAEHDSGFL